MCTQSCIIVSIPFFVLFSIGTGLIIVGKVDGKYNITVVGIILISVTAFLFICIILICTQSSPLPDLEVGVSRVQILPQTPTQPNIMQRNDSARDMHFG